MTESTSGSTARATTNPTIKGLRRAAIIVIVASLSLTAIIGIVILLGGGSDDLQSKILATSALVAAFSALALCHLAIVGRPVRVVGFVGLAVGAVALVLGLVQVWSSWDFSAELFRWFVITAIGATSLAHANLLLLLAARRHPFVRLALAVTLVAIAAVAVLLILPIATDGDIPGDASEVYWRWFGVTAIIDALGTILTPILALFLRDSRPALAGSAPTDAALEQRIATLAAKHGLDRDALLTEALDAFEASRRGSAAGD